MAALAHMGLISQPETGYNTPAATGIAAVAIVGGLTAAAMPHEQHLQTTEDENGDQRFDGP